MKSRKTITLLFAASAVLSLACQPGKMPSGPTAAPTALSQVPASRFNFRYEADVPGPPVTDQKPEDRNAAVQADFDQNRPQEVLDETILSPDKKRVLAVYHQVQDVPSDYRLDMYSADGKAIRKITPDAMAAHFPDSILWSPDSTVIAFVAMTRAGQSDSESAPTVPAIPDPAGASNANVGGPDPESANSNVALPANTSTPSAASGVLIFRTEQLYTCNSDGEATKPITQNEGLIYFYYVWAPDSSALAALAATGREWQYLQAQADSKAEAFLPMGRPRVVEKNGRERRLDDGLTSVRPVWSTDSAKVAEAFDTQIRIYDASGTNPTQAAIPLRNQLLISSQAFDRSQQEKLNAANSNVQTDSNSAAPQTATTLPDEKTLVSFNPIIELQWTADDSLYFRTAFVKRMKNDADSATSFARWHRLIFSYQPA